MSDVADTLNSERGITSEKEHRRSCIARLISVLYHLAPSIPLAMKNGASPKEEKPTLLMPRIRFVGVLAWTALGGFLANHYDIWELRLHYAIADGVWEWGLLLAAALWCLPIWIPLLTRRHGREDITGTVGITAIGGLLSALLIGCPASLIYDSFIVDWSHRVDAINKSDFWYAGTNERGRLLLQEIAISESGGREMHPPAGMREKLEKAGKAGDIIILKNKTHLLLMSPQPSVADGRTAMFEVCSGWHRGMVVWIHRACAAVR